MQQRRLLIASFAALALLHCLACVHAAPQQPYDGKEAPHPYPCTHAAHQHGDAVGAAASLIQTQSQGRIVNHPHEQQEHREHTNLDIGLETAASGYSAQAQAVTLNTQIAVGESGGHHLQHQDSSAAGATQTFRDGEGYVQGSGNGALLPQLPPLPQQAQQPPLQQQPVAFNPLPPQQHFGHPSGPAQHPIKLVQPPPPPQFVSGGQGQGYNYQQQQQQSGHQQQQQQHLHLHHHHQQQQQQQHQQQQHFGGFASSGSSLSANAIAVPPPPPPQPRPSYGPPRLPPPPAHFSSGPAPYRPLGPSGPGPIGNVGAPRPVQHFGGGPNHQFASSNNNYQQQSFGSGSGGSYAGSFGHGTHGAQSGFSGFNGGQANGGGAHFSGHSTDVFGAAQLGTNDALQGQLGHVIRETFASSSLDPSVEKHIYVHVPPEEADERGAASAQQLLHQAAPAKKHYKIIFIKAPTVAAPNYAQLAAAAQQQSEEKTLVYVLVKKPDEPSLEELQQLQQQAVKPSKPEVYFIKYKTRSEGEQQLPQQQQQLGPIYTGESQLGPQILTAPGGIDIRVGGESGAVSTSGSYSNSAVSSSQVSSSATAGPSNNGGPQPHDLYGVPIQ